MPDHKFLQELEHHTFKPWRPDDATLKEFHQDQDIINDSLIQRDRGAADWKWAASRWNLLSEPVDDPRLSNILLPFIRMIGSTAISSLSQAHRKNVYKPRQRTDDAKAILWQSASDHVDNACGMQRELDDFYTNFVVLGTAGLEDYVHLPHINRRYKEGGKWKHKSVRDFSRPKIGTRSRTPWSFGFLATTSDPNESTPVFMRDFYSFNQFIQEFANVYLPDGTPKYENCECVSPGQQYVGMNDGESEYEDCDHDGVSVIVFQDPVRDIYRIYANGVRILDMPLHEYNRIQKTTLSIAQNNHQYDDNLRVASAYGMGDTHLLKGLDALYQAIGNLNIDNYKLANTNLISIRGANGARAIDEDFDYLSGVRVEGDVIVSPMGTVRLGDYQAFKDMIDQWAIWTTKVNFQQLVGDTSKTAFELQQRIRASNQGNEYKAQKLAAGCFKKQATNRLSFIMSDMTVEEYQDLDAAEIPAVQELIKAKKVPKEDYQYKDGTPVKRVMRQKVKVKNRDIEEEYEGGKRSLDSLIDRGPADRDSEVAVVPEYFWSVEYAESGAVPDIEVEIDLGAERELRFQKMQFLANYGRQRIAEASANPQNEQLQTSFSGQKLDEEMVRAVDLPMDSVMESKEQDEDGEKIDETISQIEQLLTPNPNVMAQQNPTAVQNVDAQGLGSIGEQPNPAQNPVNAAAAGALGAA